MSDIGKEKNIRIAVFAYETRNLNTYPSIINSIRLLANAGYSIDLYLPMAMTSEIQIDNVNIYIIEHQEAMIYIQETVGLIKQNQHSYNFILAYYLEGLIIADILNQHEFIPTAYFSMELFYYDCFTLQLLKKMLHRDWRKIWHLFYWWRIQLFSRKYLKFAIIQDEERAKVLKLEFPRVSRVLLLPNGYIGYNGQKSDYAYRVFGISLDKKIILYTGGLERGFDIDLLTLPTLMSDEYVLVLNIYSRDGYADEVIKNYSPFIKAGKLVINQKNLDEEDYDALVRSSYICLAWYSEINPKNLNMYYMGLSSGKLTKYLSCGKPVILPAYYHGYTDLVLKNKIGHTADDVTGIWNAIREISFNYFSYCDAVKNYYDEKIEFEKLFQNVMREVEFYV